MKISLLFFILLCYPLHAFTQDKSNGEITLPYEELGSGRLLLINGEELKGRIRYNNKRAVVSVENGNDSRTMTSKSVSSFDFFDEHTQKQRTYFVIDYMDSLRNMVRPQFFELVKDLKNFAVLIKTDLVVSEERKYPFIGTILSNPMALGDHPKGSSTQLTVTTDYQTQTIYFMDTNGEIKPYLSLILTYIEAGLFYNSKHTNKVISADLLKEYVGNPSYARLLEYAKEKELSFKKRDDFLKIIDYYDILCCRDGR